MRLILDQPQGSNWTRDWAHPGPWTGEVGPGTLGAAFGTQGAIQEEYVSGGTSKTEEDMMYEAYYSYDVNDGMTITPLVYIKEGTSTGDADETGLMVKSSFSF